MLGSQLPTSSLALVNPRALTRVADLQGSALVKDLLNIEVVAVLNQAFCHLHHYKFCSRTDELMQQCGMVRMARHIPISLWVLHRFKAFFSVGIPTQATDCCLHVVIMGAWLWAENSNGMTPGML